MKLLAIYVNNENEVQVISGMNHSSERVKEKAEMMESSGYKLQYTLITTDENRFYEEKLDAVTLEYLAYEKSSRKLVGRLLKEGHSDDVVRDTLKSCKDYEHYLKECVHRAYFSCFLHDIEVDNEIACQIYDEIEKERVATV